MKVIYLFGALLVMLAAIGCGDSDRGYQEKPYEGPSVGDTFVLEPSMVKSAEAVEEMGAYSLQLTLNPEAADKYGTFTHANLGKTVKIVMDGKVLTTFDVAAKNVGETVFIPARWSKAQADAIVAKLKS